MNDATAKRIMSAPVWSICVREELLSVLYWIAAFLAFDNGTWVADALGCWFVFQAVTDTYFSIAIGRREIKERMSKDTRP